MSVKEAISVLALPILFLIAAFPFRALWELYKIIQNLLTNV